MRVESLWQDDRVGDRNEWTEEDYALVTAYGIIEAYTDKNGITEWQKQADRDGELEIFAERKTDPFQADVDRITSAKKYTKVPGEYFVPDFKSLLPDGEMPTYLGWVEKSRTGRMDSE